MSENLKRTCSQLHYDAFYEASMTYILPTKKANVSPSI